MIEVEFKLRGMAILYKRMQSVPRSGDAIQILDDDHNEKRYVVYGPATWDLREYPGSDNEPGATVHLVEV